MAPEKAFDRPKARNKFWPNLLRGRVGGVGHRPSGTELKKGALEPGGAVQPQLPPHPLRRKRGLWHLRTRGDQHFWKKMGSSAAYNTIGTFSVANSDTTMTRG